MAIKSSFSQAYETLNKNQRLAVDTLDGPVMVIAGPGTGKTQILATRIANILNRTDTPPGAVLALTFTDAGAVAMRTRLISLIGSQAYRVNISTFHSFTSALIQEFPDYFIYSASAQPLTQLERLEILHQIVNENDFQFLKPVNSPFYYLTTQSAIPSALQTLKREGITPPQLKDILHQELKSLEAEEGSLTKAEFEKRNKDILKNLDLLKIYQEYQRLLLEKSRYDFDDMINWVLNKLKEPDSEFLSILQERYHYFLIDEYQDTNSAQNEIVSLLSSYWGQKANIFVVGDDEQSIFRFQGASLENALNFQRAYPDAKIITLTQNYRSTQTILDSSRDFINHNHTNLQSALPDISRNLKANVDFPNEKLNVKVFTAEILEHYHLAQTVKQLLDKQKVKPSEIAIIASTNDQLKSLSNLFAHLDIPHQVTAGTDVLNSLPVKYATKLLRVIYQSRLSIDDLDLFTLLHYPFLGFNRLDILKLTRAASKSKKTLIDFINSPMFKTSSLEEPSRLTDFLAQIADWNQLDSTLTFSEFFEHILFESKLLSWVLNSTSSSDYLRSLNSFFEFVKQLSDAHHDLSLKSFLETLDLLEQNHLTLEEPALALVDNQITLTTAHKAKGLEWEYVFIVGCIDGRWGNSSSRQLISLPTHILKSHSPVDPLEEQRRLFYVSLTRAKHHLTISYSSTVVSYQRQHESLPSQFISEIDPKFIKTSSPVVDTKAIDQLLHKLLAPASPDSLSTPESELIDNILKDFRLSATALDTYLQCPYKFKLNNLLKVPRAKQSYLSFGTAVHSALERFYKYYQTESHFPDKNYLIDSFRHALSLEVMTSADYKERLTQGEKILSAYYDFHQDKFTPSLATEKFFGFGFNPIHLDDIPLSGKIDRIDWADESDRTVKVVDYKTGKRKTRGEIEGTTADSDGNYKRQLVFYKLLIDLDKSFPVTLHSAELDFVQAPHDENKPGKESFVISPEEVEELKKIIKSSMAEIRAHHFGRTTDYAICSRCEFKDHCWPTGTPSLTKL